MWSIIVPHCDFFVAFGTSLFHSVKQSPILTTLRAEGAPISMSFNDMSQHQQLLKNLQNSESKLPAFSGENLFLPENHNDYQQLVAPGGFVVPSLRWLEALKIEFPLQKDLRSGSWDTNSKFMEFSRQALEVERKILNTILDALDQMAHPLSESFQIGLLQRPAVQNLIRRLDALRETHKQIIPGTYLGTRLASATLGKALEQQLKRSWDDINREMPPELTELCADWGRTQHAARSAIICSSWVSLVNRASWPVPTSFETNMGFFLEGKKPPQDETFAAWQTHIDSLARSTDSPSLRISLLARAWQASGISRIPEELLEELRCSYSPFPVWEQHLRDERSVSPRLLAIELFPNERSRPLRVDFRYGVPEHIVILEQQALEFGSSVYLSNFDIRKITITYPQEPEGGSWRRMKRSEEIEALADSPVAEFISDIEFDCANLDEKECLMAFGQQLDLLSALEVNDSWRNSELERSLDVTFKHVSNRIGMLLRLKLTESASEFDEWKMQSFSTDSNFSVGVRDSESLTIRWILDADVEAD